MKKAGLTFLLLASMCLPSYAYATTYYVKPPPSGNDANSGLDWAQPKAAGGAAIGAVGAGDEIWVAAGTYPEHIKRASDGSVTATPWGSGSVKDVPIKCRY